MKDWLKPNGFWGAVALILAVVIFVDFVRAPKGPLGLATTLGNFGQNILHTVTIGSAAPTALTMPVLS